MSQVNDDLFQDSTMTFGEHLEELRSCLIRALYCLLAGFAIGLYFGYDVVDVIKSPLEKALRNYYVDRDVRTIQKRLEQLRAEGELVPNQHLVEMIIRNERITPSIRYVDPYAVAERLSAVTNVQASQFAVQTEQVLRYEDIKNPDNQRDQKIIAFAKHVTAAYKAKPPSPGKRVGQVLSKENRELLAAVAKKEKLTEEQRGQILKALNEVLHDRNFYDKDAFESVFPASESLTEYMWQQLGFPQGEKTTLQKLLEEVDTLPDYEVPRVNRWLFTDAFEEFVEPYNRRSNTIRYFQWTSIEDDRRITLKTLNAHEMFIIYIKAALIFGGVVASPGIFFFIWAFVAAGLYPHEKRYIYYFLPMSIALFLAGAALAFFFVFEPVLQFLLYFNQQMQVDPDIRISEWMGFALFLPVGFGIAFQLPLVMLFLNWIGIFDVSAYMSNWRISVLVIFVISMLLTPADPTSMMLMAGPLCLLYGLGIGLCKYWPRSRSPYEEPEDI